MLIRRDHSFKYLPHHHCYYAAMLEDILHILGFHYSCLLPHPTYFPFSLVLVAYRQIHVQ